jgi:hypothetical protein
MKRIISITIIVLVLLVGLFYVIFVPPPAGYLGTVSTCSTWPS